VRGEVHATGTVTIDHRPPGVAARITPLALLGGRHASRVLERNILVYRRSWIFIVSGFFEPLFYLLSIGLGLSHLVGPIPVDGQLVPYTAFVAPGLLASSAMNGAMRRKITPASRPRCGSDGVRPTQTIASRSRSWQVRVM